MKNHNRKLSNCTNRLLVLGISIMLILLAGSPVSAVVPAGTDATTGSSTSNTCDSNVSTQCLQQNPIVKDIQMVVNFLSAGVGVVIVGMIILGGIQYTAAGDNPEAVKRARQRIGNALLALLAYAFMFAFLQWLIPGGIFK